MLLEENGRIIDRPYISIRAQASPREHLATPEAKADVDELARCRYPRSLVPPRCTVPFARQPVVHYLRLRQAATTPP